MLLDRGEGRGRIAAERGGVLGEVLPGAERRARPRQHHGAHAFVAAHLRQGGEQLRLQLGGEGVAAVRAVEGDRGHRVGPVDLQDRRLASVAHRDIL